MPKRNLELLRSDVRCSCRGGYSDDDLTPCKMAIFYEFIYVRRDRSSAMHRECVVEWPQQTCCRRRRVVEFLCWSRRRYLRERWIFQQWRAASRDDAGDDLEQ